MSDTRRGFMAGVASTAAAATIPSSALASEGSGENWADYVVLEDEKIVEIQDQHIKASQIPNHPEDIELDESYSLRVSESTIQGPLRVGFQAWDSFMICYCALYNEGQEPPERPTPTDFTDYERPALDTEEWFDPVVFFDGE